MQRCIAPTLPTADAAALHVLLLAYFFPPDGGPGAQRPISFARHLPGHGVRCTVLTRAVPAQRGPFDPEDPAALHRVTANAAIVRAAPANGWPELHPALVAAGDRAISADPPDVILATMSPFELWRVADELGRRHRLPVVFDLRDPWALDGVLDYRSRWHWRRAFGEMRRMLQRADGVVANTPECRRLFVAAVPGLDPARITAITNGWDRDDFPLPDPVVEPGASLTLVHGGSFLCDELYADERPLRRLLGWLRHRAEPIEPAGRTPLPLLRALRRLREAGERAGREVRLCVLGRPDASLDRCVRESGVADAVELAGYRPHAEVVATLRRADALFLTLHGLPAGRRSRIVPGKTYEYLAAARPILAGLPDGDAKEFVERSPRSFVAPPCDEAALATRVTELHARWRDGAFRLPERPPDVERFERAALAGELAAFLRQIAAAHRDRAP